VLEEISIQRDRYGAEALFFFDDEFIANRARLKRICSSLAAQKPLKWACQARADLLTEEILLMMKEAGCRMVGIGFESAVQRVLDLMNKKTKVEEYVEALRLCRKAGVAVYGNFIFGTPTETYEEMLETLDFIKRHDLKYVSLAMATPFPGTALWETAAEMKLLPEDVDYGQLDLGTFTLCDTMEKEEFLAFFNRASQDAGIAVRRNSLRDLFMLFLRNPVKGLGKLRSPEIRRQLAEKIRLMVTRKE